MTKSEMPNFQMIHIASELVALVGITFYFTTKHNSVMSEIKKLQTIIQKQQTMFAQYDQKIKELTVMVTKLQSIIRSQPPVDAFPQMFDDPVDVFGQMMGGPLFARQHPGRSPENHNIHIVPDDQQNQHAARAPRSDDDVETGSQLDAQLSDELAELTSANTAQKNSVGGGSQKTNKHQKLDTLDRHDDVTQSIKNDLNADRSNNNSVLSINDADVQSSEN